MKKKSCVWLICILLCMSAGMKGQKLTVENGVAITKLPKVAYNKDRFPYQLAVGCNYMEKDWYFLSSSIGYLQKGGRDGAPLRESINDYLFIEEDFVRLHNITLNTVFNVYKTSRDGFRFFVGAGPRIDFRVRSNFSLYDRLKGTPYEMPDPSSFIRPVSVGLKLVTGVSKEIGSIDLGLNFAYLPTFNNPGKLGTNFRDRTFTVGVVLGLPWLKRDPDRVYSVRRYKE